MSDNIKVVRNKDVNIGIQVVDFKVLDFSCNIIDDKDYSSLSKKNKKFHFEVEVRQSIDSERELLIPIITIEIYPISKSSEEKKSKIGHIRALCTFNTDNFQSLVNGKVIELPDHFVESITHIALNTCRGAISTLFRGTILEGAVLPLVDVRNLVEKDIEE